MTRRTILLFISIVLISFASNANNSLEDCWKKQVKPLIDNYLKVEIEEEENVFSHSMIPWEQRSYQIKGGVWINGQNFLKADTLTTERGKVYYSKCQYGNGSLLFIDYGDAELFDVTESFLQSEFLDFCRYSPVLVLDYFYKNSVSKSSNSTKSTIVYEAKIFEYNVSVHIDRISLEVVKITSTSDLEIDDEDYGFGDVKDVFLYKDYVSIGSLAFPQEVEIIKLNHKLIDHVRISNPMVVNDGKNLLDAPEDYQIQKDKEVVPDITIERYSKNISFINLHHCGTRSLMVEFSNFVLVAEAPLNSKNGELLLNEVKKITPNKPIKYFAFGHFHPHYTGGMRPFIHQGAQIICIEEDKEYVEHIANTSHLIRVDSLQVDPKVVKFDFVHDEKVISDGAFEMTIYHIGSQSNHTNDYLIYYFPKEKMVFQDDLIRLRENSTKENLSKTTKGFYKAVKKLGIEVEEVVQNWHVFDKSKRMIFKFEDIERIVLGK